MKSKICVECLVELPISDFGKQKAGKFGVRSICKKCATVKAMARQRTKEGLVTKMYSTQRGSSRKRGYSMPTYTKNELYDWLMSQEKFHVLYDNWKRLDYQKDYVPSVDRKNEHVGYTMANIQLMTWTENRTLHKATMRLPTNTHPTTQVAQYTLDGDFVQAFNSGVEAGEEVGICPGSIQDVCRGGKKTNKCNSAGGFQWRFIKEGSPYEENIGRVKAKSERAQVANSGYKGISQRKDGKYVIRKTIHNVRYYVGVAATLDQAVKMQEQYTIIKEGECNDN